MQGHQNPGTLVAEVKMMRTQGDCAVLVIEGPDDLAFWRAHKVNECEAVMAEGKPNAIGCMVRLEAEAVHGVLVVVDADYDVLMGPTARAFSHSLCGFSRAAPCKQARARPSMNLAASSCPTLAAYLNVGNFRSPQMGSFRSPLTPSRGNSRADGLQGPVLAGQPRDPRGGWPAPPRRGPLLLLYASSARAMRARAVET